MNLRLPQGTRVGFGRAWSLEFGALISRIGRLEGFPLKGSRRVAIRNIGALNIFEESFGVYSSIVIVSNPN